MNRYIFSFNWRIFKLSHITGGTLMPIVTIKLLEGRSIEQKRALVKEVTEAISRTANAPKENIHIILEDMAKSDYATEGVLKSDF